MLNYFGKLAVLYKVNIHRPYEPVVPFLGHCPKETKTYVHKKIYMCMLIALLFRRAKAGNNTKVHHQMNEQPTVVYSYNRIL